MASSETPFTVPVSMPVDSPIPRPVTRRGFLKTGSIATAASLFPISGLLAQSQIRSESDRGTDSDGILFKDLALRAVDAAKAAGATYADVRLTRTLTQSWMSLPVQEAQMLAVGVRALVNGYWGFASSPYWTLDEMSRLANEAVAQARINARGKPRVVDLARMPVASGSWTTPITTDPFSLSYDEMYDVIGALASEPAQYLYGIAGLLRIRFVRTEKTCASTEGSLFTQTMYTTGGDYKVNVSRSGTPSFFTLDFPQSGAGFEYIQEARLFDAVPGMIDNAIKALSVPVSPVEIGRFDVVFDARAVVPLISQTIGVATQLDRALGYEANAGGTSLFDAPLDMLGTTKAASPSITITADRTMPRGCATVQWDDEGVRPEPFPLIKQGILSNFQTTREQAAWLAPYYQRTQSPVRSYGCSNVTSAMHIPMQHTPNLVLEPGSGDLTFDDMIADTKRGVAVLLGGVVMDFQGRSGSCSGVMCEIRNGKIGPVLNNAGLLFTTEELWNNTLALGGARSAWRGTGNSTKGEPVQASLHSVRAVPMKVKDLALIDIKRKT